MKYKNKHWPLSIHIIHLSSHHLQSFILSITLSHLLTSSLSLQLTMSVTSTFDTKRRKQEQQLVFLFLSLSSIETNHIRWWGWSFQHQQQSCEQIGTWNEFTYPDSFFVFFKSIFRCFNTWESDSFSKERWKCRSEWVWWIWWIDGIE